MSLTDQLKQILEVVAKSLNNVQAYHEKEVEDEVKRQENLQQQRERLNRIRRGEWHDGRLDCVAGNGIMSELGIGDEIFDPDDSDVGAEENELIDTGTGDENKANGDYNSTKALPVVVIRGFEDKVGGKSELLEVIAQWATSLVENRVSKLLALYTSLKLTGLHLRLDCTCYRAQRQPRKRQTAHERYWGCWPVIHRRLTVTCSQPLGAPQHDRPLRR